VRNRQIKLAHCELVPECRLLFTDVLWFKWPNNRLLGEVVVPIYVSASQASAAGQRSIEHLSEVRFACSSDEADLRKQLVATAIGAERERVRKEQLKVIVSRFSEQRPCD
jgi:hypothetical protein